MKSLIIYSILFLISSYAFTQTNSYVIASLEYHSYELMKLGSSGVNEIKVQISPNPANSQVNIRVLGEPMDGFVTLFDSDGKAMIHQMFQSNQIMLNIKSLTDQTYTMVIKSAAGDRIVKYKLVRM
ncbi:MAG: hypothetical protein C0596_16990 [Marinilabiliales bacterium]|nr:MAG: hypothetical protein C0596_16990 [Marinilabiliales bacterium]